MTRVRRINGLPNIEAYSKTYLGGGTMLEETKERGEVVQTIQFVREYGNTRLKLDLLVFWSRYPHAMVSTGVIAGLLDCNRRVDLEEALESFVQAKLIEEKHTEQGLRLYCLATDPEKRQGVLSVAACKGGNFRPVCARG
jgi:hypothetical protein